MRKKAIIWRNWIRQQELDAIAHWLKPRAARAAKVLEIGGGNGFLAKCLADMGFDVISIDPEPREPSYFPVSKGDCTSLEFEDGSFDVIFSSNVLEHVDDLPAAFCQMKRVLKNGGIMVHTVPTHYSTIFTLALQPIGYLIKIGLMVVYSLKFAAFAVFASRESAPDKTSAKKSRRHPDLTKRNIKEALMMVNPVRFFISWSHGTSPNCFTEIRDWKPRAWCDMFKQAGFEVRTVVALPVAHSRHAVLPFRLVRLRRWLAAKGKNVGAAYLIQC